MDADEKARKDYFWSGERNSHHYDHVMSHLEAAYRDGGEARRVRDRFADRIPVERGRRDAVGRKWVSEYRRRVRCGWEEVDAWWRGWVDAGVPVHR